MDISGNNYARSAPKKLPDQTTTQLGKILNKSQQGYNHIEAGRAELKIEDLIKLCEFYNLSADYLIGLIDEPKSYKK